MKKIPKHYVARILTDSDLKKNDIKILLYLCQVLSSKQVREFKNKTIINYLNIDKSTLSSSLKLLREKGFIIKHSDKDTIFETGYTLNFDDIEVNESLIQDDEYYTDEV